MRCAESICFTGRSKYIEKVIEQIPKEKLHLGEGVQAVIPQTDGSFIVREVSGKEERYDKVILAYVLLFCFSSA